MRGAIVTGDVQVRPHQVRQQQAKVCQRGPLVMTCRCSAGGVSAGFLAWLERAPSLIFKNCEGLNKEISRFL